VHNPVKRVGIAKKYIPSNNGGKVITFLSLRFYSKNDPHPAHPKDMLG
jgi:hypothetical protein